MPGGEKRWGVVDNMSIKDCADRAIGAPAGACRNRQCRKRDLEVSSLNKLVHEDFDAAKLTREVRIDS